MRVVLVAGDDEWSGSHIVWGALSGEVRSHGPFALAHGGGSTGVDALAHDWLSIEDPYCDLPCCDLENQLIMRQLEEQFPVDKSIDGPKAIKRRNQRMVDRGPDVCHVFTEHDSHSATDLMKKARHADIAVVEHRPAASH